MTPLQSFENGQALILVVFHSFSRLILSLSFLCSSVYEALFALSFSFLIERFSSAHAKAALAYIIRVSLVGFYRPILTLSMCAFGPRNSAYAFWTTTDTHIYISREISIEHPSVGLASLAQLKGNCDRFFIFLFMAFLDRC